MPAARPQPPEPIPGPPTHADVLRGQYGPDRSNNDLLYYHLDIRVDPEKKFISGKNTIRFKMLADGRRIQLDLNEALTVDRIVMGATQLKSTRDDGAVFVEFPETLRKGKTYSIDFFYSGHPTETGRFGAMAFRKDPAGRAWINTACEETGASMWWPNKDQWKDEVRSMDISVAIPNGLTDVSNGKFVGSKDLGDGYTQWNWKVQYPINNYDVSLNIGQYTHFSDRLGSIPMDYYVLPEDLEKAKRQFAQAPGMLQAFGHYFGEYPFKKDGYKLIEAPYPGMEHQSAVTYGNHFANGYLERDWTGVGISPRFDFIIIHESGHEWFGNAVTAADRSDMWIHEGWTTYLESLYVEFIYGKTDALRYLNAYKSKVQNRRPIIPERGVNASPPQDQYFKGALFLNTMRSVVSAGEAGDKGDKRWFALIRGVYQRFKYKTVMTEEIVAYFQKHAGDKLHVEFGPIFDQYLRHTELPTLELTFDQGSVTYRWKADEPGFAMPVEVGTPGHWEVIRPTTTAQTMPTTLTRESFEVATDLYYVNVSRN